LSLPGNILYWLIWLVAIILQPAINLYHLMLSYNNTGTDLLYNSIISIG